jgi:hypothetical protein
MWSRPRSGFETNSRATCESGPATTADVVLSIQKLTDEITVDGTREAAADARVTFGSALTREQIDAPSDDPNEARQQLADTAVQAPSSVSTA